MSNIKEGDQVTLPGKVTKINGDSAIIEIAPGVTVVQPVKDLKKA